MEHSDFRHSVPFLNQTGTLRCSEIVPRGLSYGPTGTPVIGQWSDDWITLATLRVVSFTEACKTGLQHCTDMLTSC